MKSEEKDTFRKELLQIASNLGQASPTPPPHTTTVALERPKSGQPSLGKLLEILKILAQKQRLDANQIV